VAVSDRREIFRFLEEFDAYVVFGARDDSLSILPKKIANGLR